GAGARAQGRGRSAAPAHPGSAGRGGADRRRSAGGGGFRAIVGFAQPGDPARRRLRPGPQGRHQRVFFRAPRHARSGARSFRVAAQGPRQDSRDPARSGAAGAVPAAARGALEKLLRVGGGGLGADSQELLRRSRRLPGHRETPAARSDGRRCRLRHRLFDRRAGALRAPGDRRRSFRRDAPARARGGARARLAQRRIPPRRRARPAAREPQRGCGVLRDGAAFSAGARARGGRALPHRSPGRLGDPGRSRAPSAGMDAPTDGASLARLRPRPGGKMVSPRRRRVGGLRPDRFLRRRAHGAQRQPPGGDFRCAREPARGGQGKKEDDREMTGSEKQLREILSRRVAILDGAMGTMIQARRLDEAAFRGARFAAHPRDLKGCNDVLCITQPDLVADIHFQYLQAGADIVETNTFNSTAVSMADYGLEPFVYEMNVAGARAAKAAVARARAQDPGRPRFVAGAMGPTNRTCSISTDVQSAATRGVTFDELVAAYYEQARGLIDGGADLLLVETIFDTLNAKAAFFAIAQLFDDRKISLPIMASVTFIQPGSNRGVTGQTVEAFWNSISHVPLFSVGMNCALGPKEMRPLIDELSGIAPIYVSAYPNAGLPDPLLPTGFPETPETLAPQLAEWVENGWLNIVGGCCGTTPAHIEAIAAAVKDKTP